MANEFATDRLTSPPCKEPMLTSSDLLPPHMEQSLLDVSDAVISFQAYPPYQNNQDFLRLIPGWPNPDPRLLCHFSVPGNQPNQPSDRLVRRNIDLGMGRGVSGIHYPLGDIVSESPLNGVWVPDGQRFYTSLGTKGNGPTSSELYRAIGRLVGGLERRKKAQSIQDTWGLCWEAAIDLEQTNLELFTKLGVRTGRVVGAFTLDPQKLTELVAPYYSTFPLYDIRAELAKSEGDFGLPAIIVRVGSGCRAIVYFSKNENPGLDPIKEAYFSIISEAKIIGIEAFARLNHLPAYLKVALETVNQGDLIHLQHHPEDIRLYLELLCFLMWRNHFLLKEYNENVAKNTGDLIFLNFKPSDWDISGNMFDTDIIALTQDIATRRGINEVYQIQRSGIEAGMAQLANRIQECFAENLNLDEVLARAKEMAMRDSSNQGFLKPNQERLPFVIG